MLGEANERRAVEKLRTELGHLESEIAILSAKAAEPKSETKINFRRLVQNLEARKNWVAGQLRALEAPQSEAA